MMRFVVVVLVLWREAGRLDELAHRVDGDARPWVVSGRRYDSQMRQLGACCTTLDFASSYLMIEPNADLHVVAKENLNPKPYSAS